MLLWLFDGGVMIKGNTSVFVCSLEGGNSIGIFLKNVCVFCVKVY